jgi:glycosyltransferase involved in cell wall biosynthesis
MSVAPLVSACVPAWNAEPFVGETLAALQAQHHENLEILVSVDQCDDGTVAVCQALAATDPRIRVVAQAERLGWIGNTNWLLQAARGEYLFIAYHDDLYAPAYVSKLLAALLPRPDATLAYADLVWHEAGQREVRRYPWGEWQPCLARSAAMLMKLGHWYIPGRGLVRQTAIAECGGLQESAAGQFSADWPWLLKLALHGPFVHVPEALSEKQLLGSSLSKSWSYGLGAWLAVDHNCRAAIRAAPCPATTRAALLALSALSPLNHLLGMGLARLRASR